MKSLWQQLKITNIKEIEGKTIIQAEIDTSKDNVLRYQTPKGLFADIKFQDDRVVNHEQRKKFYATVADITDYTGYDPNYMKELLKFWYCAEFDQEYFSLSDCSLEVARELITFTLEFAMDNDIPLTQNPLERTEDIFRYLSYCIRKERCCICPEKGTVYTIDADKNKMCMCENHRQIAKDKGLKEFCELWKVYGIQIV